MLYAEVADETVAESPYFLYRAWTQMMRSYRRRFGEWPSFWSFWKSDVRQVTLLLMADHPVDIDGDQIRERVTPLRHP